MPVYNPLFGPPLSYGDLSTPEVKGHPLSNGNSNATARRKLNGDTASTTAGLITAAIVTIAVFHFVGIRASLTIGG